MSHYKKGDFVKIVHEGRAQDMQISWIDDDVKMYFISKPPSIEDTKTHKIHGMEMYKLHNLVEQYDDYMNDVCASVFVDVRKLKDI